MTRDSYTEITLPKTWDKREHSRTTTGAGTIVEIELTLNNHCRVQGLAVDGSFSGCGVVTVSDAAIASGQHCTAIVGGAGPIEAKVVWVRELERNILRLGLQYL
ncbi:hypothetical protein [Synechococcus sp. PCC 7336]|uniref:hypothetical protein n=1 Tax=Synechococcus sp. PCC 7336 TaxID=195250 RepID=UPI00036D08A6|nr:hypothetical protein [Synechococcus sp. PCC 7336]